MRGSLLGSVVLLLLIGILSLAFDVRLARSESATMVVPDDFSTIQGAINDAVDGDTVFIKAGTYYEHVVVNKTLSLVGDNSSTTIIDGSWTGVVIKVVRNGVIISGLTVQRSGSIYWENAGILLDNVENCSISESILTENSFAGLELNQSHRCNISGNRILSNGGVGITAVGGSFNDLSRNTFAENGWSALTLNDYSNGNTISENSMTSNNLAVTGHCVNLYRSSNNTIQKNSITDDDNGIRLEYWSNYNIIFRNDITSNTWKGISVERYSDYNTISQNNISMNDCGFYIESSIQNSIYSNNVLNNAQQILAASGSVNTWDDGYPSGGNHWSDYAGSDYSQGSGQNTGGSDGIGDTNYSVNMNNIDHYPLMGIFSDFDAASEYHVQTICNSTISDFQFNGTAISFSVSGDSDTAGFCRICIPTALMNEPFRVFVNSTDMPYNRLLCSNSSHSYLYFNHTHSTQRVIVIPELPLFFILPLFQIAALLAFIARRKRTR